MHPVGTTRTGCSGSTRLRSSRFRGVSFRAAGAADSVGRRQRADGARPMSGAVTRAAKPSASRTRAPGSTERVCDYRRCHVRSCSICPLPDRRCDAHLGQRSDREPRSRVRVAPARVRGARPGGSFRSARRSRRGVHGRRRRHRGPGRFARLPRRIARWRSDPTCDLVIHRGPPPPGPRRARGMRKR